MNTINIIRHAVEIYAKNKFNYKRILFYEIYIFAKLDE